MANLIKQKNKKTKTNTSVRTITDFWGGGIQTLLCYQEVGRQVV